MPEKISIDSKGNFCDEEGNVIILRGVNIDPSVKYPASAFSSTHFPDIHNSNGKDFYNNADTVSYLNHPFPVNETKSHITRLKSLGYNCIRFPITWDALEHEGPGVYDFLYMDYIISILKEIRDIGGIYVYIDPHQDVWSRFSGGSGAPLWTFYSAGLQPKHFDDTNAATFHHSYIDTNTKEEYQNNRYPKMLWPTNYFRLAAQTMFTLFFAGKYYAPKCIINGENIQDYLQNKFIDAFLELYKRIELSAPELIDENVVIGLESMNEPNHGYLGQSDLTTIKEDRGILLGPTPTSFESFKLGEGIPTNVANYVYSKFGFTKDKDTSIDPKGKKAWLTKTEAEDLDTKYGWKRDSGWDIGSCVWRMHGVWSLSASGVAKLEKPTYFYYKTERGQTSSTVIDEKIFVNNYFVDYYTKLHEKFRNYYKTAFLIMQPPPLNEPPILKGSNVVDNYTILACHYYDGMTLLYKTWNKKFNVDTLGIVRKKYSNPILSLSVGESAIRKSIVSQIKTMFDEAKSHLGNNIPVIFTEIGIPFDMDNKDSYKSASYANQVCAMDALQQALEKSNISYSLWCYCHLNSHEWGDGWNNEDFSLWSADDANILNNFKMEKINTNEKLAVENLILDSEKELVKRDNSNLLDIDQIDLVGFRALDAILRPFPIKINGQFKSANFNLKTKTYNLRIDGKLSNTNNKCTEIYLPLYHFPIKTLKVRSSSQKFSYDKNHQILLWYHESGPQYIEIGLKTKKNLGCIIT